MSIVICPSCGAQFMARGNRETVCQKCGFPIPAISFKPEPLAAKPQPVTAAPAKLVEFTDQPSPFAATQRENRPPAGQKPVHIPFSTAGSQAAAPPSKPFVQQPHSTQPGPSAAEGRQAARAPAVPRDDVPPAVQPRPKNLSSISALAGKGGEPVPAAATRAGRTIPAVTIPGLDDTAGMPSRPSSPAPVVSTEGRKPSGSLVNPLNLRGPAPAKAPASQAPPSGGKDSLEKAMKAELETFKDKMDALPKVPAPVKRAEPAVEKVELPFKEPENLGDILRELAKIDPAIKASALVKRDGTILASAISTSLSDSLVAIIATTVTTVGSDIIFATESGELKYITFGGTTGLVHVVPTIGDIFLIILTGSSSKQGIISVAAKQVEKGVKAYLNL